MDAIEIVALATGGFGVLPLIVGCRVGTHIAYQSRDPDWGFGAFIGTLSTLVWPLVIIVFLFRGCLLAPPRAVKTEMQNNRYKQLMRENEQLDRELGM